MDNNGMSFEKTGINLSNQVYVDLAAKLAKDFGATPGRKRPRNLRERETLLRWEKERGGKRIGTI